MMHLQQRIHLNTLQPIPGKRARHLSPAGSA